jgi:hypothetical protein
MSGARPAFRPQTYDPLGGRDELRGLWNELSNALAPSIRLLSLLGEGGMGLVFLGWDESLKRDVAVKVLAPRVADDSVARARFTREAEAAAAVAHPNIVGVYQVGELPQSRIPYIVMQYVDGPTLADAVGRVLPEARVRRLMAEIASALAAAHRRHVVHRDVKPANIALDGETGRALVLDFGISAALSSRRRSGAMRLTTEGMYLGTPTYMSPEQASGDEVTTKSDVYSLGVLMYEVLTGKPPFDGNALQIMAAHVKDKPASLRERREDLSPETVAIVDRCLEKDPADRPTAQEIVNYLQPPGHSPIEWPPPGTHKLRRSGARMLRSTMLLGAATVVFFTLLGLRPAAQPTAWGSLLGAVMILIGLLMVAVLYRVWTTVTLAHWAHTSGYPWRVVFDVASDYRADTTDLRNRNGPFAVLDATERERVRRLRRAQVTCMAAAFPISVVELGGWVLTAPRFELLPASAVLSPGTAALFTLPIAVCLVAALALFELELRTIDRAGGAFQFALRRRRVIDAELVKAWLKGADQR